MLRYMAMENGPFSSMIYLLTMVMFHSCHSYVELPEGTQHSAVKTDRREA